MTEHPDLAPAVREALRAIVEQRAELDRIRNRAVGLFAAASISTAFLVGQILPLDVFTLLGLVCYLGIGIASLIVMSPSLSRIAGPSPREILEAGGGDEDHVAGPAIQTLEQHHARNQGRIDRNTAMVEGIVGLMTLQIILWTLNAYRLV